MTKSIENAKPIAKLLEAVRGVMERDVALKLYALEDLRLTIESRKELAKTLIAGGASEREAAQALGVERTTIRRDVGKKKQPGGGKSPATETKSSNKSNSDGANSPELEGDETIHSNGQGQKKDRPARNTRGWLNEAVKLARTVHKNHGESTHKHLDPNILRQAVDEPEKKADTLRKGARAFLIIADKLDPPPPIEDTESDATSDADRAD